MAIISIGLPILGPSASVQSSDVQTSPSISSTPNTQPATSSNNPIPSSSHISSTAAPSSSHISTKHSSTRRPTSTRKTTSRRRTTLRSPTSSTTSSSATSSELPSTTSAITSSQSVTVVYMTTTVGGSLNTEAASSSSTTSGLSHNSGAIAGLTIGLLAIIGFVGLWFFIARRRRKAQQNFDASQLYGGWPAGGDPHAQPTAAYSSTPYNAILSEIGAKNLLGESDDSHDTKNTNSSSYHAKANEYVQHVPWSYAAVPMASREWLSNGQHAVEQQQHQTVRHSAPSIGPDPFTVHPLQQQPQPQSTYLAYARGSSSSHGHFQSPDEAEEDAYARQRPPPVPPTSFMYRSGTLDESASEPNQPKGFFARMKSGRRNSSHSGSGETLGDAANENREIASQSNHSIHRRSPSPSFSSQTHTSTPVANLWNRAKQTIKTESVTPAVPALPQQALEQEHRNASQQRVQNGLLDPRLALRKALMSARQDSSTSLRDHVDYSRPIGALIHNNSALSTTTLASERNR